MKARIDGPQKWLGRQLDPYPPVTDEDIAAYREWMKRPPLDPLHRAGRRRLEAIGLLERPMGTAADAGHV